MLNQWLLSLFRVERFDELAEPLRDDKLEGLDENNVHRFHHALALHFPALPELPVPLLLEYDQNIVRHSQRLNERRLTRGDAPIVWKYFQYVALLFTEVYLDRFFRDPAALRSAVGDRIAGLNAVVPDTDKIAPFSETADPREQLNKLALWCATGSGKTLLMHANILQYRHYLERAGLGGELDHIILLTPNEGLSRQHLGELEAAGIHAEIFDKEGRGLYAGTSVEIIDINKLKEEMGEKTVAVESFEGRNLVLVDEGHRGASAGEEGAWMRFRNALCERGFSFEYSATFGQAVKDDKGLTDIYARSILFDYSYRYFYGDGFGKDYQILNLDETTQAQHLELYLTACLLAFFQQQRLFREGEAQFRPFLLERPLCVFVGGSVTKTLPTRDASDIVEVLKFLQRFVTERAASVERVERVLHQGLVTAKGRNLFADRFGYLNTLGLPPASIFEEMLQSLFNSPAGGALLVENLKGAPGEIALRIGDAEPFGVVNVGDDSKLVKLCGDAGITAGEREFAGSLFHDINAPRSTVNVLIGSRKFTEGWNSWRVSTMGLMNIGKKEGAQIIQLFGRGVRLRGHGQSLKRSSRVRLPERVTRPKHIDLLETISIFGIHADYMAQFRDFLSEEGLPSNEQRLVLCLPIVKLGKKDLKIIRLKKAINGVPTDFGQAFRRLGPVPTVWRAPRALEEDARTYMQRHPVVLNWYPKIQALRSRGVAGGDEEGTRSVGRLSPPHIAFLDVDALFFELERYKAERGWWNLNLSREAIVALLTDETWYEIEVPEEELRLDAFEKVRVWQEVALALLREFTKRYYTYRKSEWELRHLEYGELADDDPNFPRCEENGEYGYRILVEESQHEIVAKLKELMAAIKAGALKSWEFRRLKALWWSQHLYEPLLHMGEKIVEVRPAPLNDGELRFVEDLKAFHDAESRRSGGFFEGKELYLLRNLSKGRGVGFFEAGNFHPDFILWLLAGGKQHVAFVDPKGTFHMGRTDPKIEFHRQIKDIEKRLGDPDVLLSSFIVSNTASHVMQRQWDMDKLDMLARHILFQDEDRDRYVRMMLEAIMAGGMGARAEKERLPT